MNGPGKIALIATVKNEGPWLLEWIAHNLAIGFGPIVIASNDCCDGTDAMLDRLAELGWIRHLRNDPPWRKSIQHHAYEMARATPEVRNADWVMALDADEFLNVHRSDGSVRELIEWQDSDVDAIAVNWRVFGDSGLTRWQDTPVCETFVMANNNPRKVTQIKTLFRGQGRFTCFSPHSPWLRPDEGGQIADIRVCTASAEPLPEGILQGRRPLMNIRQHHHTWSVAQVNHYMTKTRDIFDLKKIRGRALHLRRERHTPAFFRRGNRNDIRDESIRRSAAARADWLATLHADPVLDRLHAESCVKLLDRIAQTRGREV